MRQRHCRTAEFQFAALFLVGGLICLLRNPLVFLHPIAGWEDGTQGIDIYGRAGAPLFHTHLGYARAWPNLIYRLVMFAIPLPYVPYAFGLVALGITATTIPALCAFMHNALQVGPKAAVTCAIVIGIVPAGDWIMMSNVDDSIWPVAASLILCTWNPLPDRVVGRIAYVSWRVISVATNPLTLPVTFVWATFFIRARRKGDRWVWGLLIGAAIAYGVFGIEHRPGAASAPGLVCAQALRLATQSSLLVLFPGSIVWGDWPSLWLLAFVLVVAVIAIVAVRRRPGEMAVFCLGLGAMCVICALGRGVQHEPTYLIYTNRYAYVQRLLWCCLIAGALVDIWNRYKAPFARIGIALGCTFLISVQLIGLAWPYAWNDVATSDRLLAFLAQSSERLKKGEQGPFTLVRKDQYGDWSIVVGNLPGTRP